MKLNLNFTVKQTIKYIYITIILANLAAIIILVKFTDKYVYQTISVDRSTLVSEDNILTGDVDMDKFNSVYVELENKKNKNEAIELQNIFK